MGKAELLEMKRREGVHTIRVGMEGGWKYYPRSLRHSRPLCSGDLSCPLSHLTMDEDAKQHNLNLYNRVGNNSEKDRRGGVSFPLKRFHNNTKRNLIQYFVGLIENSTHRSNARLLDLACGRGGDIRKWIDCKALKYVLAIDISRLEIDEAKRRWAEHRGRTSLRIDFEVNDQLGVKEQKFDPPFDVVTCMFAVHYFFASESSAQIFFKTVSDSLCDGGYFIGTMPEGKRILELLDQKESLSLPMLSIQKKWSGREKCFGSAFLISIADTVTEGQSLEYLVFFNAFEQLAKKFNLFPIHEYHSKELNQMFDPKDQKQVFKHFHPNFPASDRSLEQASSLNVAFVFQKRSEPRGSGEKRSATQLDQVRDLKKRKLDETQ